MSIGELNYDQLVSLVMYENEEAYKDPTGYFCSFIKLADKDDYCKSAMTYLDPKLCKIEITRELRATYGEGKGRDFMKTRDVFLLAGLDLAKLSEPEVDEEHKTSRQNFESDIVVHWQEGYQYSLLLDAKGAYRACLVNGAEEAITEEGCVKGGQQSPVASKKMSLLFNSRSYNRAMAALKSLRENYCVSNGDAL